MSWKSRWLAVVGLFAGCSWYFAAPSKGVQQPSSIRGFSDGRVEAERKLERQFRSIPDAAHAENDLRQLASAPHMAGTEASHRTAEWLLEQFRSYGLQAEVVVYSVWLPLPREVKLDLLAPVKKTLASQEEAFEVDPDTSDPRAVVGFNAYSPSGDVTAPAIYVNYGMPEDYRELESLGVSVAGKIAIVRYGRAYRGIKARVAEEHKAAGVVLYSDPQDDGYAAGDPFPQGPWRPMSGIQRGSILYTEIYPGDPLTPGIAATPEAMRLAPSAAANLPRIPVMPVNAQDAAVILANLGGQRVPRGWQGGLPFTYHVGSGEAQLHLKLVMDYQQRPVYDVIARLRGTSDDEWVLVGNHYDAWVFGAVDPSSGTAVILETARVLGELVRTGWKPQRTIVLCEWGGEEFGLLGSTEWVEANRKELQSKAVVYMNTDVGVAGPNFGASATPSLKELVREATREVTDPATGRSVYDVWRERVAKTKEGPTGTARSEPQAQTPGEVPLGPLGSGSDFCAFFDFAGIPSLDLGFGGEYGVYHSLYDDFYWMKHFGDPSFAYHVTLARILGTVLLRLDGADVLPFDYVAYAQEMIRASQNLEKRAEREEMNRGLLAPAENAASEFYDSASHAAQALSAPSIPSFSPARLKAINQALVGVEESMLAPEGLSGRPWYKHTLYAPGSLAGYAAVEMPGVSEALDRKDPATLRREVGLVAAALRRAASRLDEVARLAQPTIQ